MGCWVGLHNKPFFSEWVLSGALQRDALPVALDIALQRIDEMDGKELEPEIRHNKSEHNSREKLYTPPPPPPFLAKRHFPGEGGGGVYFEAPRGRNFIRPPLLYTPHP